MRQEVSNEIDALLRYYGGRKFISVADIREFSRVYVIMAEMMQDKVVFNGSNVEEGK